MDKLRKHFSNENQRKSRLFKQLFLFQNQIEEYDDEHFQYRLKVQGLLHDIDELMGMLIDDCDLHQLD